jgi:Zn-finger protein
MKVSLRKSINAFCKGCIYDKHAEGAWREQVTRCTSCTCPLYPVRPVSKAGEKAAKSHKAEEITV